MMSWSAFSQNFSLEPRILTTDQDTLYCFSKPQARELVKLIEYGFFTDSVNRMLEQNLAILEFAFKTKQEAYTKLELMNNNMSLVHAHQESIIDGQLSFIKAQKKEIKRHRRHKFILMVCAGVIGTTAILR
ncbi:hypothetical protein JMN32_00110 [Fulvivirga sp. 29W222]|uniref:Uncharacterized protein n=1 Tax=Fulvivirga marina TaxID=2494733 RepID=A0A937FUT3_9BACT|nr:hypothetical protein [Fulvivirga marina]MBL6444690.1 hypothetical protein [Fulvivirga marina]